MEWAWAGAGDSPRGRAEPGPGVASPPMPPRPSAPVLRGSRRGPPRVRGWAMGGGRWGGELVRRAGELVRRTGGPSPRVLPVGVARRRHLASACHRGAVRTQLVGGPPPWVQVVWYHPCAAGRIAIVWLVVEWPSRHWPCVAVPGGRQWWPARGSVPRWRAWAGTDAVGPSPVRVAEVPAVRDLLPSRRAMRGGRRRARSARRWPSVFGLAAAGAVPLSHRGAPVRPACRRGVAAGVAAAMIPVHTDPPASCRRAAVLQLSAEKDYSARATTPAPRRRGEATLNSFAAYIDSYPDENSAWNFADCKYCY